MDNQDPCTELDLYYTDLSNASNNAHYRSYDPFTAKTHMSRGQPVTRETDKDEFYIYSTCVSMRGEQAEYSPRLSHYRTSSLNRATIPNPAGNTALHFHGKDVYNDRIKELTHEMEELKERVNGMTRMGDIARDLDQNVLFGEIEADNPLYSEDSNRNHFDETDDEAHEVLEEICTVKRRPAPVEYAENTNKHKITERLHNITDNSKHHMIDLNSEVIDEGQFPASYWSRLESYFYKRFQAHKYNCRSIGIQLEQISQRTTATMATPISFKTIRCVGVSVFPMCREIGLMTDDLNTSNCNNHLTETDEVFTLWLSNNYPQLNCSERNLIKNLAELRYNNPEKFVALILSLLRKSSQDVTVQTHHNVQCRSCSTSELNLSQHKVTPLTQYTTQSVQAQPVCRNRGTSMRHKFRANVACNTEQRVLRSQGTSTTRIPSVCQLHGERRTEKTNIDHSVRRKSPTLSALIGFENGTTQPGIAGNDPKAFKKRHDPLSNRSSFTIDPKKSKFTSKEENTTEHKEKTDEYHKRVSTSVERRGSAAKLFGTSQISPRSPPLTNKTNEGYTVLTERRILDELHERHLCSNQIDVDQLANADELQFNEAISQVPPLSTSHSVREFEPVVEIFHHTGDMTEEIQPSSLPREIIATMGNSITPDLSGKCRSRSNSRSSSRAFTNSFGIGRESTRTPVSESLHNQHNIRTSQTIPQPHVMSTNNRNFTRNYKYELNSDVKRACESFVGIYQAEQTGGRKELLNDKFLTIVKAWFDLTTSRQTDLAKVEDFLAILHSYSSALLCDVVQSTDENDNSSLHYAIGHGAWQVVNLILDTGYAHPDQYNHSGYSALMIAAISNISDNNAMPTLKRLFSLGDTNLHTNTITRQTALMLAALHGSLDICALLVDYGADVNAQDASGNTALMCAVEQHHLDIVNYLVTHPNTDLTLKDNNGKDALLIAQFKNNDKIIHLLQSALHKPGQFKQSDYMNQ